MRWIAAQWQSPRGGATLAALARRFVAVDLETTGRDWRRDAIVSIAVVPFVDGERQPGLITLVRPGSPIPAAATAVHGITDAMVERAPGTAGVLRALEDACRADVLVGHGIGFDLAVIARHRRSHGLPPGLPQALDTMRLAAGLYGRGAAVELEAVAARLGVEIVGRHTAEGDAVAAGEIFLAMLPLLETRGLGSLSELLWFQAAAPLRP